MREEDKKVGRQFSPRSAKSWLGRRSGTLRALHTPLGLKPLCRYPYNVVISDAFRLHQSCSVPYGYAMDCTRPPLRGENFSSHFGSPNATFQADVNAVSYE